MVAECETELLKLDDFEELITHLKVRLDILQWKSVQQLMLCVDAVTWSGELTWLRPCDSAS